MPNDGWCTAEYIINRYINLTGPIWTDPCWCPGCFVKPKILYIENESLIELVNIPAVILVDGLSQAWWGNTWGNPPYSSPDEWCYKLLRERAEGRVTTAGMLLNSTTETKCFRELCRNCTWRVEFRQRLGFYDPERKIYQNENRSGQTLFLFGDKIDRNDVFFNFGDIADVTPPSMGVCYA